MAELRWLNHAGYVLRAGDGARLGVDPWLSGTAFDDGWALLSPSAPDAEQELSSVDHLWISHEHPDHFSPAALRSIPEARRPQVTVWYQPTRDRRVLGWCESAGFRVEELGPRRAAAIGGLRARSGSVNDDSWLFVEVDGMRILNLNDCETADRRRLEAIGDQVGAVDVLLTQFSYANGMSRPADRAARAGHARQKLGQVRDQIEVLRPSVVVPFASFVWFCHEENDHLNDEVVTIDRAVAHIEALGPRAVVLAPGDRWELGTPQDPAPALERYRSDLASVPSRPRVRTRPVARPDLLAAAAAHRARVAEANQLWALRPLRRTRWLEPARLEVTDLEQGRFRFDLFDGLVPDPEGGPVDVALSAESLAFCFRHGFGLNTLQVNGRFEERRAGGLMRLRVHLTPAVMNSHGRSVPRSLLAPSFLRERARPVLARLRRQLG